MNNAKKMVTIFAGGVTPAPANIWTPQGIVLDAGLAAEEGVLQEPSILYEGGTFKMWYSYAAATRVMGYATSSDGYNWTRSASNPVVANGTRAHVLKDGTTYYMYVVLSPGGLSRLSSADGVTWATDATGIIGGDVGEWDADGVANMHVWIEGITWYMLYEANAAGGVYKIGLATSPDGLEWTKSASNPVITNGAGSVSHPWVYKLNGTYYAWVHVATTGALPTDVAKFSSTNLTTWTRYPTGLTYSRIDRNEGAGTAAGQVADVSLVEVDGTTYMYFTAYLDGSTASGKIKLATAPYGLARLAGSAEGIISTYQPLLIFNEGFERLGTGGADIFANWTESPGTGTIERTTTAGEFHAGRGIAAVKLTAGSSFNTNVNQSIPAASIVDNATYRYTGWARGDGTNSGRVRVFRGADLLTPTAIPSVGVTGTSYQQFTFDVVATGTGNMSFYCYCPGVNGGVAYFDDLSVKRIA